MLQYFDTLTNIAGTALTGATLQVLTYPGGVNATIYSTNGTSSPIANATVTADITGQVSFFVPDGVYTFKYSYQGTLYKTRSPVQVGYVPDVRNWGADSSGTADSTAAVTACAAANNLVNFPQGSYNIASTPTVGTSVLLLGLAGAIFSGAGASATGFLAGVNGGLQVIQPNGGNADIAAMFVRRLVNYSGGSAGFVNAALKVQTDVTQAGTGPYEWAFVTVLNNSSTSGQNVAGYRQGNRVTSTASATWAGVDEAIDKSGAGNPTVGLLGLEVDVRASGTDSNGQRIGVDVVLTRYPYLTGTAMHAFAGVRIQNGAEGTNAKADNGFLVQATSVGNAFTVYNGVTAAWGLNFGAATFTSGAAVLPQGAPICFDANAFTALYWDGSRLRFDYGTSGRTLQAAFANNGAMSLGQNNSSANSALYTSVSGLSSVNQISAFLNDTLAGTTSSVGVNVANSILASTAVTVYTGVQIVNPTLNAGATIGTLTGFHVGDLTSFSTNAYAIQTAVSSGSGKFNLFINGSAPSNFSAQVSVCTNLALPAGGATTVGIPMTTTANFGLYAGSGAPTFSAAQGSVYMRSDGSSTSTRLYVNTTGSTTWTNFTSAA
jgi:hypothetical protein